MRFGIAKENENLIFIGLGSNLGDLHNNIHQASNLLAETFQTTVVTSSLYRSEPVEVKEQPWFLNQVAYCSVKKEMTPLKVLAVFKKIEADIGREAGPRYGPRLIDLDLLFFEDWVFENKDLIIPHPKITERSFVLQPLAELAPNLVHPALNRSIREIYEENLPRLSYCEKI